MVGCRTHDDATPSAAEVEGGPAASGNVDDSNSKDGYSDSEGEQITRRARPDLPYLVGAEHPRLQGMADGPDFPRPGEFPPPEPPAFCACAK